jgi:hypothetical protein
MSESTESLERFTILDGKCHVFQRAGSPFWWCGIHFKGKYIRTSTKEKTRDGASSFAHRWYFQKQTEIASGTIANPKETFGQISKLALQRYEGFVKQKERSQITLDGIKGVLSSRVIPYFDKIPVSNIDNACWHKYKSYILEKYPLATRGTLHQYKNAVRVVLNEGHRLGIIKDLPVFKDEYHSRKIINARPWFNSAEYTKLHRAIFAHAEKAKKVDKLQYAHAMELYDYVIFGTTTGMRVGELNNVRFCDVKIVKEKIPSKNGEFKEFLIISNIKGKRGTGNCQSYYGAVAPFRRLVERRQIKNPSTSTENLFLIHHRHLFNIILEKTKLKYSNSNPPARRDFVSLRATYICFRLRGGAPIYEVANNCRTSVAMIEQSYARHLGGELLKNINRNVTLEGWDD